MNRGLIASSCTLLLTAGASAEIIPSWRLNTITPAAMAASNSLLTPQSRSVSLMITLAEGSLFNVAGLDLDGLLAAPATVRYFNRTTNSINQECPNPDDVALSPGGILGYDTCVCTAALGEGAATPGRLNDTGNAQIGNVGLLPTSGSSRVGQFFNVAWGATPNNGSNGTFEIANITFASGVTDGFTPIPLQFGRMYDSLNPDRAVALPPIPVAIPEPASVASVLYVSIAFRRRFRS